MKRRLLKLGCAVGIGLVAAPVFIEAQSDIHVQSAELSVPFGVQEGSVVLVDDRLIFVDATEPSASFAIAKSNVATVDQDGEVVTIAVRRPGGNGRRELSMRLSEPDAVVSWHARTRSASATASAQRDVEATGAVASYQAQHDHRLGTCLGQLIIMENRLAFESISEVNDSRQWAFDDIREVRQDGIYKLSITPFIGNSYNLQLVGRGMDSAQYRNLVDKITGARAR